MSSPRASGSRSSQRGGSSDTSHFTRDLDHLPDITWGRRRRQPRVEQSTTRQEVTEEELRRELSLLGFSGIPRERLLEFKQDLEELMERRAGLIPGPEGDMARGAHSDVATTTDTSENTSSSEQWSDQNNQPSERWGPRDQRRRPTTGPVHARTVAQEVPRAATADTEMGGWADFSPWPTSEDSQPMSRDARWTAPPYDIPQEWPPRPNRVATSRVPTQSDSYSKHTVAAGRHWPSTPMTSNTPKSSNLQVETLVPPPNSPGDSSSSQDFSARRPMMKRKVLRRRKDGQTEVTDESVISDTDSEIWERRAALQGKHKDEYDSDSLSSDSLPDRWIKRPPDWNRHKSFIRPRMEPLLNGYRKRTDPVAKYMEYKQSWDSMQVSVEKGRRELRWGIREQMLCKAPHVISRPPQVYVPNDYVVPTEKKRYALRWGVRYDLVNGIIPQPN